MHKITKKTADNYLTVIKIGKGNTLVITYIQHYVNNIEDFIKWNKFELITTYITEKLQKQVRKYKQL